MPGDALKRQRAHARVVSPDSDVVVSVRRSGGGEESTSHWTARSVLWQRSQMEGERCRILVVTESTQHCFELRRRPLMMIASQLQDGERRPSERSARRFRDSPALSSFLSIAISCR